MDKLQWIIELLDRASGPARKVAAALDAVRVAKDRVAKSPADRAMDSLERATASRRSARQRSLTRGIEEFARSQQRSTDWSSAWNATLSNGAAILGAVGAVAFTAAGAVGRVGMELGRSAAEAADWRTRTIGAFDVLGRAKGADPAQAREMFETGSRYAQRFGLDVREVQRSLVGLTAAGIQRDRALQLMQAAGDLGALEGGQAGERAITAFRQIQAKGLLQMEELQGQLSEAGLNTGDVIAEIGRMRGLRGPEQSINTQVRSLITNRQVNATQGIDAALRVIARRSGGRLGGTLDTQSNGMSAALNRLSNGWLMVQSTFASTNGFRHAIAFIDKLARALDPATQTGRRFGAIMNRVFDDVLGLLDIDKSTKGGIAPMFNRALDAIERVIEAGRILAKWSASFGGGFWLVIGPALELVASAAGWLIEVLGGDGAGAAVWIMKALGVALGGLVVLLYTLVALAALPFVVIGLAIYGVVRAVQYLVEQLDRLKGYAPDWMQRAFGWDRQQPAPALSGATPMVDRSRDPAAARPVISQPNVNINVAATAEQGLSAQGIADGIATVIPGVVADATSRASA